MEMAETDHSSAGTEDRGGACCSCPGALRGTSRRGGGRGGGGAISRAGTEGSREERRDSDQAG